MDNKQLLGYDPDLDVFEAPLPALQVRPGAPIDCAELALALLEHSGRPSLAAWLGQLVQRSAAGRPLHPARAAALVGQLHQLARHVLPYPQQPAGAAALRASRFFGIELEGLSPEDQEFESARRFIAFTQTLARRAARPTFAQGAHHA